MSAAPVLLSLEAIIGAGKSTLLEELDSRSDVLVVREPVDLWQQQRGSDSVLDRFYQDQKANAFMFQVYAMMSTAEGLRKVMCRTTPEIRAVVMERSWLSARYCFVDHLRNVGNLDELEYSLHGELFQWGLETWPKIEGVVFMDLPVAVAQARVAERGRMAESTIPSDYQEALSSRHRKWLCSDSDGHFEGPVLKLDGSGDRCDGAITAMAARVMEFVDQLQGAKRHMQVGPSRMLKAESSTERLHGHFKKLAVVEDSESARKPCVPEGAVSYLTPVKLDARPRVMDGFTPVKRKMSEVGA